MNHDVLTVTDRGPFAMSLKVGYEFEQGHTVQMSAHPDAKEALSAFSQGRRAVYRPLARST
jgi:hypothetical protein